MVVQMPTISCVSCDVSRAAPVARDGSARTPRGWKILRQQPYCPACKHSAYSLRALILPVSGPHGASWAELRDKLRELWAATTRCSNWMMTELYARDVRRQPGERTLSAMPRIYLYPEARELFPSLSAQAVAALAQEVRQRYRARRYDLLWTRTSSIPTYRYPVACAIPAQAWSLHEHQESWTVSLRLGDHRWSLRLRGGPHMRYHSPRLRQILAGEAEKGSVTIYETAAPGTSHRNGSGPHGTRVMLKIAAWLPKASAAKGTAILRVRTHQSALLIAEPDWHIDPTPLRGVLAADARRRTAIIANLRLERGQPRRRQRGIETALSELSRRSRQRLAEACRTYAAHLATYAKTRGAAVVQYDDTTRSVLSHFPWEQLRRRVAEKLDEHHIEFIHVNQGAPDTKSVGLPPNSGAEDAA
jgi:hypothetical protein